LESKNRYSILPTAKKKKKKKKKNLIFVNRIRNSIGGQLTYNIKVKHSSDLRYNKSTLSQVIGEQLYKKGKRGDQIRL
jgi:hypothetical protein